MSRLNVDTIKNRLGTAGPVVPSLTVTNDATVGGALTITGNFTDGGDGTSGYIVLPEERKRRSERMKGVKRPQWIYDKIAASNRGKKASPETREKISAAGKNRKCSEEHKRKVSEAKANPHKITFDDGREIIVENAIIFCKENDYIFVCFYNVRNGKSKYHKDIIKVELVG